MQRKNLKSTWLRALRGKRNLSFGAFVKWNSTFKTETILSLLYCQYHADIDECSSGSHNCDSDERATCTNTIGSYLCSCKEQQQQQQQQHFIHISIIGFVKLIE